MHITVLQSHWSLSIQDLTGLSATAIPHIESRYSHSFSTGGHSALFLDLEADQWGSWEQAHQHSAVCEPQPTEYWPGQWVWLSTKNILPLTKSWKIFQDTARLNVPEAFQTSVLLSLIYAYSREMLRKIFSKRNVWFAGVCNGFVLSLHFLPLFLSNSLDLPGLKTVRSQIVACASTSTMRFFVFCFLHFCPHYRRSACFTFFSIFSSE